MRTIQRMASITFVSLAGAFLALGCSHVDFAEKASEEALSQSASSRPDANKEPSDKHGCKPDPGPGSCTSGELGDGVVCQDIGTLKQQITDACTQAGLEVSAAKFLEDGCPSGDARLAAYTCCPAPLPKP